MFVHLRSLQKPTVNSGTACVRSAGQVHFRESKTPHPLLAKPHQLGNAELLGSASNGGVYPRDWDRFLRQSLMKVKDLPKKTLSQEISTNKNVGVLKVTSTFFQRFPMVRTLNGDSLTCLLVSSGCPSA